jgi:large subunit ribosomal protein L3
MRKGIKLIKTFKKSTIIDINIKNKYNISNLEIEDKFSLNSLLKEMNLDPLVKYKTQAAQEQVKSMNYEFGNFKNSGIISHNDIDAYNAEILAKNNFELTLKGADVNTMRLGLVGEKVGMTSIFNKWGAKVPVTVLKVENNQITNILEIEGRNRGQKYMVEVGGGFNPKATLSAKGHFYKNNIPPKRHVASFKVTKDSVLPLGYILSTRHFIVGQKLDVQAVSKGKGTEGVMTRWGFKGGVASHGNSLKHRGCGSIGNREFPARVWPGKKMAGKTGNEWITQMGALLYKADFENGLLYVRGGVPGNVNEKVLIKDCFIKYFTQGPYLMNPTFIPEAGKFYENVTTYMEERDTFERYPHDNDERMGVSDEEEEGPQEDEEDETEI